RLSKLLDDEVQQDELFWSQDALKEEAEDDNYQEEPEIADEFDSDFDQDPEPDEEQPQIDADERMNKKKKRLVYPGKTLAKKKKKKKTLSNLDNPSKNDDDEDNNNNNNKNKATEDHDDAKEIMIRKSTRTSVIVRQAERDAIRAAIQATSKVITTTQFYLFLCD
ncbi:vacuolar protein sorting-associated protein 72, partial [Trifolium medium]|nr:vacuolar protein sorting-associated protein 72 [Trifolium medium]